MSQLIGGEAEVECQQLGRVNCLTRLKHGVMRVCYPTQVKSDSFSESSLCKLCSSLLSRTFLSPNFRYPQGVTFNTEDEIL